MDITEKHVKDQLISYLSFKQISINDDGLHRFGLIEYHQSIIAHAIKISVSGKLSFIFRYFILPKYQNMQNSKFMT